MGSLYYRCCWHRVSNPLFARYSQKTSSLAKLVYNPKTFFLNAVSLDQGFPHCPIFSAAASRRSMDRISVPLLGVVLSHPLPVIALVSSYLTNKLIGRRPIPFRLTALPLRDYRELPHLSMSYAREWGMFLRVTNPSAGTLAGPVTCMPYPHRQRSS